MKIVTHNGYFHTDDLLAVSTLLLKYPDAELVRTRDEGIIGSADIVVDVGHVYDPRLLRFDHHMSEGAGVRENGIPYASVGLVWKEYGKEMAGGEEEAQIVDEGLIMSVDAEDNGVDIYTPVFEGVRPYTIGSYFDSFTEGAETLEQFNEAFLKALPYAKELIEREIRKAQRLAADIREVKRIFEESPRKDIIVLPLNKSWKRALIPTKALCVIFPRPDGQWSARAIPKSLHSFELKHPFPKSWAGLRDEEMARVSGVPDATFCHRDLWLANAQTLEGAVKLAEIALNS